MKTTFFNSFIKAIVAACNTRLKETSKEILSYARHMGIMTGTKNQPHPEDYKHMFHQRIIEKCRSLYYSIRTDVVQASGELLSKMAQISTTLLSITSETEAKEQEIRIFQLQLADETNHYPWRKYTSFIIGLICLTILDALITGSTLQVFGFSDFTCYAMGIPLTALILLIAHALVKLINLAKENNHKIVYGILSFITITIILVVLANLRIMYLHNTHIDGAGSSVVIENVSFTAPERQGEDTLPAFFFVVLSWVLIAGTAIYIHFFLPSWEQYKVWQRINPFIRDAQKRIDEIKEEEVVLTKLHVAYKQDHETLTAYLEGVQNEIAALATNGIATFNEANIISRTDRVTSVPTISITNIYITA